MRKSISLNDELVIPKGWSPIETLNDFAFTDANGNERSIMMMDNHGAIVSGKQNLITELLQLKYYYTRYVCWRHAEVMQSRLTLEIYEDDRGYYVVERVDRGEYNIEPKVQLVASHIDTEEDAEAIARIFVRQYQAKLKHSESKEVADV